MGGTPSKGTPADKRLTGNKPGKGKLGAEAKKAFGPKAVPAAFGAKPGVGKTKGK